MATIPKCLSWRQEEIQDHAQLHNKYEASLVDMRTKKQNKPLANVARHLKIF